MLHATASTIYHWGDVELYLQWESKSDCITYILGLNCTFTNQFALFLSYNREEYYVKLSFTNIRLKELYLQVVLRWINTSHSVGITFECS